MKRMPSTPRDYMEIASRRRWWLIGPIVIIPAFVFIAGFLLPRSYRSEAIIMIDPQKVPDAYVQATVSDTLNSRLQMIQEEILSRGELRKVIIDYGLYNTGRNRNVDDRVVEMMRNDISVELLPNSIKGDTSDRSKVVSAFKVAYINRDAALAQKVTRTLASLFIEQNLKDREQQSEGTIDFLDSQLERMRSGLEEQEKEIEAYKLAHAGELPEQQAPDLQMLGQTQSMLQMNADAITRAQQQRAYLLSILQSQESFTAQQDIKSVLETDYDKKMSELLEAEQKYSDRHPDVIRLKAELAALRAQVEEAKPKDALDKGRLGQSPAQIQAQIDGLDQEINMRRRREVEIEKRIANLQLEISALPKVEQEIARLTRDYSTSREAYDSLLAKRNNSSVSADMERRAQGEQFRILDPASYPLKPHSPDLLKLNLLGLLASVFAGCGLALVMELTDSSIYSERDLTNALPIPVLASVPRVFSPDEQRRAFRLHLGIAASVACVVLICAVAGFHERLLIVRAFGIGN